MEQWSVTLTDALQPGVEAGAAWARVAARMHKDPGAFEAKLRPRLPISLRATDEPSARKQLAALEACGVEAVLLADAGQRWWVRLADRTCGPVSAAFARRALLHDDWHANTPVCRRGESQWQALGVALPGAGHVPDEAPPAPPADPGRASTASSAPSSASGPAARTIVANGELPPHAPMPGLHAGFWMRVVAYCLDWLILACALFVVGFGVGLAGLASGAASGSGVIGDQGWRLLALVAFWLYYALFESSAWQATPGKRALGLRVVDLRGERIGFGRASGRFFGMILSGLLLGIGYMMAGWTQRKQALHDLLAACCVVRASGLRTLHEEGVPAGASRGAGMPGWAIALIVLAVCFFAVIPFAAILSAIAIPAYQSYVVRAQVSEGMVLADNAKLAVTEYAANQGRYPQSNRVLGLARPENITGQYVSAVSVYKGHVVVTFGDTADTAIRGNHLVFVPDYRYGSVAWRCASDDIARKYLPSECSPAP